jgi:hypothetical protein
MANSIIVELSRRRVFRGAAIYVIVAWLALRVVEVASDPGDSVRRLALLWAVGLFPLAVLFSWVFQVRPEGVEREDHGAAAPPRTPFGRALDLGAAGGVGLIALIEVARALFTAF